MIRLHGLVLLALCPALATAQPAPVLTVRVFVDYRQAVSAEGFVDAADKWLVDSTADLVKALDGKDFHPRKGWPGSPSHYVVVPDRSQADVVLTIAARGVNFDAFGQRTTLSIYRNVVTAESVPNVDVTRWVSMILSVGTYQKEFVAWAANRSRWSAGAWSQDAKRLALETAAWVMANESQIRARQAETAIR